MKSTTIASEQINSFYVRLKTSPTPDWYLPEFKKPQRKMLKRHFQRKSVKQDILINQIAFFHKHSWMHFDLENISGWLPFKSVRKNYYRLAITPIQQTSDGKTQSIFTCVKMMLNVQAPYNEIEERLESVQNTNYLSPLSFADVTLDTVGSFRNLSNKSLRRLVSQLRRHRSIVLWGQHNSFHAEAILLIGFNKRVFIYNDPTTGEMGTISKRSLLKYWKSGNYQALSY